MLNGTSGGHAAESSAPGRFGRITGALSTLTGAVVAFAILTGGALWLYRLSVRDPYDVPIIRAKAEAAKTRPDNPGGLVAPHQNVQSYRAAEGTPPAGPVTLAPAVQSPDAEDQPMRVLVRAPVPEAAQGRATPGVAAPAPVEGDAAPAAAEDPVPADPETTLSKAKREAIAAASDLAPAASPVAPARPADIAALSRRAAETSRAAAETLANQARTSKVQIQLAADPQKAVIEALWSRIRADNPDLLHNRALAVETTQSGGQLFYRLRIGPFIDTNEARGICQALKGRGQDCIVVQRG